MDIYRKALEWIDEGRTFALGAVVYAKGSTPQKAGSKALLDDAGNLAGTLGGGLLEGNALKRMKEALTDRQPQLYEIRLDEEYSRTAGPICGGVMRILAIGDVAGNSAAYRSALEAADSRERGALVTMLGEDSEVTGTAKWVDGKSLPDDLGRAVYEECLNAGGASIVSTESGGEVFVEPVVPMPRLLIVGGGHIGQVVAKQCDSLGFQVTVYDDRSEFADVNLFPAGVATAHGNVAELVEAYPKDRDTYIVLVSKGHKPDAEALEACVHADVAYLGMIGSTRKVGFLRKHFVADGLCTQEEIDRVVAPIGYEIGAVTVPEIGVSIAAQLVAARRRPDSVRDISIKAV